MGRKAGWRSLWRFALLAASILSSCFLLTEGQGTIIPVKIVLQPPHPAVGQNVTLTPTPGDVEKAVLCLWYRGLETLDNKLIFTYYLPPINEQTNGPASTGRETGGPGCSLHIRNLTSEDTGNYTVTVSVPGKNLKGQAFLTVSEKLSSPVLWPPDVTVAENTNLTLNCTTSNNPGVNVFWFKDGKPFLAVAGLSGLSDQNRTLTLIHVGRNSAGLYACEARNPVSFAMSNSTKITVAYGPEEIKLIPEGTVEKSLNSELKLECTAVSVPAAQFLWYFNNTEILNAIGSIFEVQLRNWTDEGNYTCQATNTFTHHSAMRTTYVKLTKDGKSSSGGLSGGAIAGIVIGTLVGVVLIAGLLYYICTKTSIGRMELHTSNGNVPSAPGQNQGVTDTKPKANEEDLQYSILAFKDTNRSPPRPTSEASQPSESGIIYSEIKKK